MTIEHIGGITPMTQTAEPHSYHWTKAQYYAMAELGFFESQRVELIEGEIIEMSPMSSQHAGVVRACATSIGDAVSPSPPAPLPRTGEGWTRSGRGEGGTLHMPCGCGGLGSTRLAQIRAIKEMLDADAAETQSLTT